MKARLFCMGRELKSNTNLKRIDSEKWSFLELYIPSLENTPIPIQFMLKEELAPISKQSG